MVDFDNTSAMVIHESLAWQCQSQSNSMRRPCLYTPWYHLVPILFRCISLKPMSVTQKIYTSVRNSIDTSAKNHNRQKAGCTGSMQHALPAFLSTLEDLMPHCRSGQYTMLQQWLSAFACEGCYCEGLQKEESVATVAWGWQPWQLPLPLLLGRHPPTKQNKFLFLSIFLLQLVTAWQL